jgi:hypothetical protein
LWGHGGFHPDFKGKLGREAICGRLRDPAGSLQMAMHEVVRKKPKL